MLFLFKICLLKKDVCQEVLVLVINLLVLVSYLFFQKKNVF